MAKKQKGRVKSRRVWESEWDGGGMAGAGAGWVYEKGGWFHFRGTEDEPGGPYPTLVGAVKAHCLHYVTNATTAIRSRILSADEIAALLEPYDLEPDAGLFINGEAWVFDAGTFRRAENDDERARSLATL